MTQKCCHHNQPAVTVNQPPRGSELRLIDDLIHSMQIPSAVITEVVTGTHFIGLRANHNGTLCTGLASLLGAEPTDQERQLVGDLIGRPLSETAELLKSDSAYSVSLGAAALNTGIIPPENQPDIEASRLMAEKGREGETVLVGHFPFTDRLREKVKTLHLFELKEVPGSVSPAKWDEILGRCHVLGMTGTTLLTRAMATFLEKAPQAFTIIIGPTTPLSPVLFDYGADVLAGCQVVSPEPVFAAIRQGMAFREFKSLGVRFVAWSRESAR